MSEARRSFDDTGQIGGAAPGAGRAGTGAAVFLAGMLLMPALLLAQAPLQVGGQFRELTVEQSVRMALERSPVVLAAEAEAEEARARTAEARAGMLPALRAQAAYTRLGGDIPDVEFTLPGLDTSFTIIPIELGRYHAEFGLEQPLFTGGRLRNAVTGAEHAAAAADWVAESARADVALQVRVAYWTLHGALAADEALDAALAGIEEHLRDLRHLFDEGLLLRSDLLAAQTRRSEVRLELVETRNAVRVARLELNRLLGLPAEAEVRPAAQLRPEPAPPALEALVDQAAANRPELLALAEQVAVLQAQEAVARGARLPELAFMSRYIYARPNPYIFTEPDVFRGTWEAGFALRWNLWEGGARTARLVRAREQVRAAEARLQDARERVGVDVARQYLEATRAEEAIAVAAEHVEHAAEALRVAREQWAEGVALPAHVLEAEAANRLATARQARALAEHGIARAALLRSLGAVW